MPSSIRVARGSLLVSLEREICGFVTHPDLKGSDEDPIPVNPEDLPSFMSDGDRYLRFPERNRERFGKRWQVSTYT